MAKDLPYVRYERNSFEDPQDVGLDLILGLRSKGVEVFVMAIVPDIYDVCSVVRYFPQGRHDTAPYTYFGPTAINFFLSKVLPRIRARTRYVLSK